MKTEIKPISEMLYSITLSYAGEEFPQAGLFSKLGAELEKRRLDTAIMKYRDEVKYNARKK